MKKINFIIAILFVCLHVFMPLANGDEYDLLLIHSDNPDGDTAIVDSSGQNPAIAPAGNTHHAAATSHFGATSIRFDGSGDYINIPSSADWNLSGDDFTIDTWVNFSSTNTNQPIFYEGNDYKNRLVFYWNASLHALRLEKEVFNFEFLYNSDPWPPTTNVWYHIALVRSGNTLSFFIDGQITGSVALTGGLLGYSNCYIGRYLDGDNHTLYFNGYLDEIRISKGIARWTENFTPPTEAYGSTAPVQHTITASAGANGQITPNGSVTVNENSSANFTITPDSGYQVDDVTVDGVSQGTITTYTFPNVTDDHTISATFIATPPSQHTITASAGANGQISPSGNITVDDGGTATFTITPNSGYQVSSVTVDGVSQGSTESYTFNNVTDDHAISATFAEIQTPQYTITASAGANGQISPSGSVNVDEGGSVTFTITPNSGYHVGDVTVNSSSQGAMTTYTFVNVLANQSISATFIADQPSGGDSQWTDISGSEAIYYTGSVSIGTDNPGAYQLNVNGSIRANEIVVNTSGADYVFEKTYPLMPLAEVKQFIEQQKHLPNIPPADEMQTQGVGISELQTKLLSKVEELTLYVIDLKTESDKLKMENQSLKQRVRELEQGTR